MVKKMMLYKTIKNFDKTIKNFDKKIEILKNKVINLSRQALNLKIVIQMSIFKENYDKYIKAIEKLIDSLTILLSELENEV